MDSRGARHLSVRLAVGAATGERVEVVSVAQGLKTVRPGDRGTLVSMDAHGARILFDWGVEIAVDPVVVQLRPVLRRTA